MKLRTLAVSLLLALPLAAQTTTPNIGLEIPATHGANWQVQLNYDFNLLDSLLATLGTTSTLGTASTHPASDFAAKIASGSTALGTSQINAGACATTTAAATGVLTTDVIAFNPNGSLSATAGFVPGSSGGLTIAPYPTAGFVNFDVCNWTASPVTPGAVTVNWRVAR